MKKLLLITVLLLLQSFPSYGEWQKISADNEKVSYIELDTVKHNKTITYFSVMFDFFEPQKGGVLSAINNVAVDCKIDMYRTLQISTYNRSMAKGKTDDIFNYEHIGWKPNGNGIMNVICDLVEGKLK